MSAITKGPTTFKEHPFVDTEISEYVPAANPVMIRLPLVFEEIVFVTAVPFCL